MEKNELTKSIGEILFFNINIQFLSQDNSLSLGLLKTSWGTNLLYHNLTEGGVIMAEEINKVENRLQDLSQEEKDRILESFNNFKNYLNDQVSKGERLGLGEEALAKAAEKVADYLAKFEEPRNSEEKVLQELWTSAEGDEKHAIAHALLRMVQK